MASYHLKCGGCGLEWEFQQPMADCLPTRHMVKGKDCGPVVQVYAVPVIHGVGVSGSRRTWQKERERDTEAYKRLRKNGVQPKGVTGAAEIETRAGEAHEVSTDRIYSDRRLAKRVTRGMEETASA